MEELLEQLIDIELENKTLLESVLHSLQLANEWLLIIAIAACLLVGLCIFRIAIRAKDQGDIL